MSFNALYYLIFFAALLSGCGGVATTPAPVEDLGQARRPAPATASVVKSAPRPLPQPQRSATGQSEMLFHVLTSIGVDYKYGGTSPVTGFDCSGLVAHVFREGYGIVLPRNTQGQSHVGTPVAADELQPGDLVFYNTLHRPFSHVGIYLGEGRFVHAPRTGAAVRIENLGNVYWTKRWNGARRITAQM